MIHDKLRNYFIWNGTFKFVLAQFSPIIICSGINICMLNFKKMNGEGISSVLSLVLIAICAVCLVVIYKIVRKYQLLNMINSEEYKIKYGVLTDGLRVKNWVSTHWNFLILMRWVITCSILIVLRNYNQFQIIFLLIISVIYQCFII